MPIFKHGVIIVNTDQVVANNTSGDTQNFRFYVVKAEYDAGTLRPFIKVGNSTGAISVRLLPSAGALLGPSTGVGLGLPLYVVYFDLLEPLYAQGFQDGVASVDITSDNQGVFNNGYTAGYTAGFTAGVASVDITVDNQTAYDGGYQEGLTQGYQDGYDVGYADGVASLPEFVSPPPIATGPDTLVSQMTGLQASLGSLNSAFGLPQYQTLVVLEDPQNGYQVAIAPNPYVEKLLAANYAWAKNIRAQGYLSNNVQITGEELVIAGIPRPYGSQGYTEAMVTTWRVRINPQYVDNVYVGGTVCTSIYVSKTDITTWGILVLPREVR